MKNSTLVCLSALTLSAGCKSRSYNEAEENSLRSSGSDKRIAVDVSLNSVGTDSSVRKGCAWVYHNKSTNLTEKIQPLNPYPFDATSASWEAFGKTGFGATLLGIAVENSKIMAPKGFYTFLVGGAVLLVTGSLQGLDTYNKSETLKKSFNDVTVTETQFLAAVELLKKAGNRNHGAVCKSKTLQELKAMD